jgi:hypothetical protein
MFFVPLNAVLKLIARFTVSVLPDTDTDDAPASSEHWLFCSVPATPIATGLPNDPESLANCTEFDARLK